MTVRALLRLLLITLAVGAATAAPARGQEHGAAKPSAAGHAEAAAEEHAGEGVLPTIARLFNFAILAGVLVYFLRTPLADYLSTRSAQIRQDLVTAADIRKTATEQLEEINRKLTALPAELEALRGRGAEDIAAEEARIAETSRRERERLLDQARREIEMRLRVARRELTEHAAQLAVAIAEERITRTMTPEDQLRLLDRYSAQLAQQEASASRDAGAGGSNLDKGGR